MVLHFRCGGRGHSNAMPNDPALVLGIDEKPCFDGIKPARSCELRTRTWISVLANPGKQSDKMIRCGWPKRVIAPSCVARYGYFPLVVQFSHYWIMSLLLLSGMFLEGIKRSAPPPVGAKPRLCFWLHLRSIYSVVCNASQRASLRCRDQN